MLGNGSEIELAWMRPLYLLGKPCQENDQALIPSIRQKRQKADAARVFVRC